MFSISKLLVLLLILGFVFLVFWGGARRVTQAMKPKNSAKSVDLIQCPHCGDWVENSCPKPECQTSP